MITPASFSPAAPNALEPRAQICDTRNPSPTSKARRRSATSLFGYAIMMSFIFRSRSPIR